MQAVQTHRLDPLLRYWRMEQYRIMNRLMKGGLSPTTLSSFILSLCLQTTGQRPLSPESDHYLTYWGGCP